MSTEEHQLPATIAHRVRPPLVGLVESSDRDWPRWLVVWIVLLGLSFALDGWLGSGIAALRRGDFQRELAALGQGGQFSSLVIVGVILACTQPPRWRRVFDLALAAGLTWLVSILLKAGLGRMRPTHESPYAFDGALVSSGNHSIDSPDAVLSHYDFSSFPSSHTSAAMVLSLFVAMIWPRLWGLALAMLVLVGLSRFAFEAHWLSDVLGGATVGALVGYPVIRGLLGIRLLDWAWRWLVDRDATPALPEVVDSEERALARSAAGQP
ncbi:MAG: phosphatase PAP2 family protein [Planctomycetota bacterium]|nr:phosphatase PAP2 family protein [Planctomycetota bacterium]